MLRRADRPRLVDRVVNTLREWILQGELAAGTPLLQEDLAARLAVSRTPLREAFRVLEHDGLLRVSNNNGTVEVVAFTSTTMREMFELRLAIDGLAARLTARAGLRPAARAQADALLSELAASTEPYDPRRRYEAHASFHTLFVIESGNRRLQSMVPLIRASSAALYLPFVDNPPPSSSSTAERGPAIPSCWPGPSTTTRPYWTPLPPDGPSTPKLRPEPTSAARSTP